MKKISFIAIGLLSISLLSAQEIIRNADGSYYRQCTSFSISRPLRDLAKEYPAPKPDGKVRLSGDDESHRKMRDKRKFDQSATPVTDPIVQSISGTMKAPAPIVNVDGQQSSQGFQPLDDNGMVGPNDFVQTVNSDYQVFDKSGNPLTTSAVLSALFPGSNDQGDPVTMYDKFADRWIIEEFDGNCYCTMMFAVSTTSDPTGTYYIYKFTPDAGDFADYPKYTIWSDGYYQTCNCQNDKVVVYERAKMIKGDKTAAFISIPWTNPNTGGGFFCPMTLNADGTLPPYGSPNFLLYYNSSSWGAGYNDEIVIDKITVNWTTKKGSYAAYQTLPTSPVNDVFPNPIDQPGAAGSLDPLDGFFSYRVPYQRWGKYNSVVMVSAVNVGSGNSVAGLRWYEIRQDTTTKQWSIYQQSTYAPNDGISRWDASIAMNDNGDIAMGFTGSSNSVYPSVRYTGRRACDSLNQMTITEQIAYAGTSSDLSGAGRWGDYSNTTIDPSDGITFWSTNMYVNAGMQSTRIVSYQLPTCSTIGIAGITQNEISFIARQDGNQLDVIATKVPSGDEVNIDMYDINGKHITGKAVMPSSGNINTSFGVSAFAKGMYFVRIGNDSYQRVIKVVLE
ncbi:MAG TPA: T9SS type A sorting domain-containing protein [Bacteroidia bacterium]|jgi:hypothetical protein|nr:T9SS type A sorting domain-containing protein [Bacteroidia bacterium]